MFPKRTIEQRKQINRIPLSEREREGEVGTGDWQVMIEEMRKMRKIDEGEIQSREGTQRKEREQGSEGTTAGGGGKSSSLHRREPESKK